MRPAAHAIAAIVLAMCVSSSATYAQTIAPLVVTASDKAIQWGPCPAFLPTGCQIGVLHGDPAKPNVDIFFKVPGKSKIAAHKHTSAERMVLVQGEMQVTYEGHKPVTLKRGSYAYGPAELVHEAACLSVEPCVLFIAFEQPLDAIPMKMAAAKAAEAKATTTEPKKKGGGC
ncbi:MAG TPA: cupin domain-containing protein [Burkholderiaceae bacterium]|nr:cupin domain-containing protein [Burkholderiaceae bacterium]